MKRFALLALLLSCLAIPAQMVLAQGTAFTYQGVLNNAGAPARGTYDFRFRLAADAAGNAYVGGPFLTNGLAVNNGLFTVTLDFGVGVFTGTSYWLEVDVRTNGALSYTGLTPLQPLTPAPYAIFANTASNLSGVLSAGQLSGPLGSGNLSGTYANAVNFNNAGNSFAGNGAGLANVNAANLGGLPAGSFWQLAGNAVAAGQFLGSTNNQPLELRAGGQRALRLEPNVSSNAPNFVAGSPWNVVSNGVIGAAIGGGGGFGNYVSPYAGPSYLYTNSFTNIVGASFGTVAGGAQNTARGLGATVSGGYYNAASGVYATVGGGYYNFANGNHSVIAGGSGYYAGNFANGDWSAIVGGADNYASGETSFIGGGWYNSTGSNAYTAVVGGGYDNQATNQYSVVAGGEVNLAGGANSAIGGGVQNQALGAATSVAGGSNNVVVGVFSSILGGASNRAGNTNSFSQYDTIAGGAFNTVGTNSANLGANTVAGGVGNAAIGGYSTIGGGVWNIASGYNSVVAGGGGEFGGDGNLASGYAATIGGGYYNRATNSYATVAGGGYNVAGGQGSLAVGYNALALHDHCFVWSDGALSSGWASTGSGEFLIHANGGVGIGVNNPGYTLDVGGRTRLRGSQTTGTAGTWFYDTTVGGDRAFLGLASTGLVGLWGATGAGWSLLMNTTNGYVGIGNGQAVPAHLLQVGNAYCDGNSWSPASDRNVKSGFEPVDTGAVLEKVAGLPIQRWHYTNDVATPHVGPMAQDFHAAFGLGADDRHIADVDEGGVALAAIQGLNEKLMRELRQRDAENAELKQRLQALEERLGANASQGADKRGNH